MWIIILFIIYIFLILPNLKRRNELDKYKINYYHRGCFDNVKIAENSLEAFDLALKYHTAIELDVHLSKDHKLIIMHDNNLSRMTKTNLRIKDADYKDIHDLKLLNTNSKIPLLDDVLKLVDSKVILYIELKDETKDYKLLVDEVIKLLKNYNGEFILCSFNPLILSYLRRKYPEYHRGLIIQNYHLKSNMNILLAILLQSQILNIFARPDLISFKYTDVSYLKAKIYHMLNVPLLAWSIKSIDDYHKYQELFDGLVIESIKLKK